MVTSSESTPPQGQNTWAARRKTVQPKAIPLMTPVDSFVEATPLLSGQDLPVVIRPRLTGLHLAAWARDQRAWIEAQLHQHGAILFRGFQVATSEALEDLIQAIYDESLQCPEDSSPRSHVRGSIYTSTDYPAEREILLHNESSYCRVVPLRLFFACVTPAAQGGETPLADCRRVHQHIDPAIIARFRRKKWMYVRNLGEGFGVPWETVFQTTDRAVVEAYCRAQDIEYTWKAGQGLRTRQIRDAVVQHPATGQPVWFNHVNFFHVSSLEPDIREQLLRDFAEEDLPNNTYYGDGSAIEPEVLEVIRAAYRRETVHFSWHTGDVVLLDNLSAAHGRCAFTGPRQILFGMARSCDRTQLPAPA